VFWQHRLEQRSSFWEFDGAIVDELGKSSELPALASLKKSAASANTADVFHL
jgi:hypothetical protein